MGKIFERLTLFLIAAGEKSTFKTDSDDDPSVTRDMLLDDRTPDIPNFWSPSAALLWKTFLESLICRFLGLSLPFSIFSSADELTLWSLSTTLFSDNRRDFMICARRSRAIRRATSCNGRSSSSEELRAPSCSGEFLDFWLDRFLNFFFRFRSTFEVIDAALSVFLQLRSATRCDSVARSRSISLHLSIRLASLSDFFFIASLFSSFISIRSSSSSSSLFSSLNK